MTTEKHPDQTQLDPTTLDRLVDGELAAAERRAAIAMIEQSPNGWRRCAVAFLEAQAWRETMRARNSPAGTHAELPQDATGRGESVADPKWSQKARAAEPSSDKPASTNGAWSWGGWVALAASILIAFGCGNFVGRSVGTTNPVAPEIAAVDDRAAGSDSAHQPEVTGREVPPMSVANADQPAPAEPMELTARELDALLRQFGHRMELRQGYVPVGFDDGRQVNVPVREVELVPIEYPTY